MSIISNDISKAVAILNNEELVAIPTETVYGLAGNIYSEKAVKLIFETKQRPRFNPLIIHIPHLEYLTRVVRYVPEKAMVLAKAFWPGPLTLVLPKKNNIPDIITAEKDTVAVRIPNHPVTLDLLQQLDFPLAAPSANPFNRISPTRAAHVEAYFKDKIKMVLDGGPCKNGIESTIIGFEKDEPVVYRLGSIALEAIEQVVGVVSVMNKKELLPEAPGMLKKHYSPKTLAVLSKDVLKTIANYSGKRIGVLSFKTTYDDPSITHQITLSKTGDLNEATTNLYNALHDLDGLNLDVIVAEILPNSGLGNSINDRLIRATTK